MPPETPAKSIFDYQDERFPLRYNGKIIYLNPRRPYEMVRNFCQRRNIDFIDPIPLFIQRTAHFGEITEDDGFHWNEGGRRMASEVVLKYLVLKEKGKYAEIF